MKSRMNFFIQIYTQKINQSKDTRADTQDEVKITLHNKVI